MGEPTVLNTATVEVFLRILFQCQGYFPFLKKRRFQFFHYNSVGCQISYLKQGCLFIQPDFYLSGSEKNKICILFQIQL